LELRRFFYTLQSKRLTLPFTLYPIKQTHTTTACFVSIDNKKTDKSSRTNSFAPLKLTGYGNDQRLRGCFAPTVGLSSQLSKAPLGLSPKFAQQSIARQIWSSRPTVPKICYRLGAPTNFDRSAVLFAPFISH
jgi:hypothetical protein